MKVEIQFPRKREICREREKRDVPWGFNDCVKLMIIGIIKLSANSLIKFLVK